MVDSVLQQPTTRKQHIHHTMSSLVNKLNSVSCTRKAVNGVDLVLNYVYEVLKVCVVRTQFTKDQLLLEIIAADGTPMAMWLPKRYAPTFTVEDISAINEGQIILKFKVVKIEEYKKKKTPILEFGLNGV